MYVFFDLKFTALITLSIPSCNSSTTPTFHLPLCLWFPFVNTTSPIAISICLWLFFILYLSLREHRYSLFHLFQAASLQRLIYKCCFLLTLPSSSNCSFWYCNWLSVYWNVRCQYRKLNIFIYIHLQSTV